MNDEIKRVITNKVRLSYVNLLIPRAQRQGDKLKYSTTLLIPKTDMATKQRIDAAINAAIKEGTASKWNSTPPVQPAIPIYDGDGVRPTGELFSPECKGHWVITASSELKPQVVDLYMNELTNPAAVYSGMYARVSIRFFPYFNSGKKGIGCALGNVQKLEEGEPLGNRTNAMEDFGGGAFGYNPAAGQIPVSTSQLGHNYQVPQYNAPTPAYIQQQPVYPAYPQQTAVINPITGAPINGGVMGL